MSPAATTTTTTTGVTVKDTELVTAIKANETKASYIADLTSLQLDTGLSVYNDQLRQKLSKAIFVGHTNTDLDSYVTVVVVVEFVFLFLLLLLLSSSISQFIIQTKCNTNTLHVTESVAGAIGAAELFGGTAAISEPLDTLNGEIVYALKNCGLVPPLQFDDLHDASKGGTFPASSKVCLVDHTEETQMVRSLRDTYPERVIGVIDHHALAKSFHTNRPIYMDLRPWGSMSTILGYLFVSFRRTLPKPIAVLLMQAILSDTLNLRSVTTTDADRSMVALLHGYAGIGNATCDDKDDEDKDSPIDYLAKKQFQAKTNWVVAMGPYEMVRGDQKDFSTGPWKFAIAVLEVTDTAQVLAVAPDILKELRLLKKEKALLEDTDDDNDDDGMMLMDRTLELDFAFLFAVNIVTETSTLLICGGRELALAKAAFLENPNCNTTDDPVTLHRACPNIVAPGSTIRPDETAMTLPKGYVSRKGKVYTHTRNG